jgi:signal transduction histidine kinase
MASKQQSSVEWLVEKINPYGLSVHNDLFDQAKQMDKEQRDTLLNYIEEVRDLCRKLRFPTEGELRELTDKADVILNQFKQQDK